MKDYTTLIFDAFDTVVHVNRKKLPPYQCNGETIHTTAFAVHDAYVRQFENIDFDVLYRAFVESFTDIQEMRRGDFREIASQERFRAMLRRLGKPAEQIPFEALDCLTQAHMNQLQDALEVRPETIEFLDWAAHRFRRGMISNFDYAPALYAALDRFGVRSAFETIMVSDEVGWRKPHPFIFEQTFAAMGIQPSEALFFGDQLYLDVLGSIQSGMDVVWLENGREVWTPEYPKPTYTVQSIREAIDLLETKR